MYVSQLRRSLGDGVLITRTPGYILTVDPDALDADRFERLLADGKRLLADGRADTASVRLREALSLWRGPALSDFRYEDFAKGEIARLDEQRVAALEERIEADLALGRHADLIGELESLVSEHPLRERLRGQLMLGLYRCGRQAEALEVYQDARRVLLHELGLEPGPSLQALEQAILRQDLSLADPGRVERRSEAEPPGLVRPSWRRRGPALILAGAVLLGAGISAGALELTRGRAGSVPPVTRNFVAALDLRSGRIAARVPVGNTPSSIAVSDGAVWVMNADDETISRIDPKTRTVVRTFATNGTPTDLAAGAGGVWIGNGSTTGSTLAGAAFTRSLARIDPSSNLLTQSAALPRPPANEVASTLFPGSSRLAVGDGAVWAINPDTTVSRIDTGTGRVVARIGGVSAAAIAVGDAGVWVADGNRAVSRIDPRSNAVTSTVRLAASGLAGIAVGAGAVWVADPWDGTLWRIDPGPPLLTRTIPIGLAATGVSFGAGSVWVTNSFQGTVMRIDPTSNAIVRTTAVAGTPQAVAAGAGAAWVSVDAGFGTTSDPAASPLEQDVRALPSSACGPIAYGGNTRIDFMVASDLPLQGPTRASTLPMTRAVQFVLEQHHFRAGRFTVGYQSCDDSTAQTGFADIGKCSTNARAYASDSSVVAVLGPYSSDCAAVEIPIANRASLAMISAQNTNPGLTHATRGSHPGAPGIYYPTGVRTYARIEPADDLEGAGDALFAHRLGLRTAYVLRSNNDPFGLAVSDGFIRAARKLGVRIVGTATWNPGARAFAALAARIARTHPAGVFLGGFGFPGEGNLLRALRARLDARVPLLATDGFLPIPQLLQTAGRAAGGLYVSYPGEPNANLPPAGRTFVREFGATQPGKVVVSYAAPYAAQATEVLLAAIAASDGTRASVARHLLTARIHNGILGSFRFDRNGDIDPGAVTILRVRGGARPNSTLVSDFNGSTIDRVLAVPATLVSPRP
jgi:DNA-binding SARP family transcriptional activator/ABC-type branched-subunit amino acid transport system substrate-binding protein/streptogramin lyase